MICPCWQLNLSQNSLGIKGAKVLAPAIAANGVLTSLNVCLNYMGEEGESALRKAIEGREGFDLHL